MTTTNDVTGDEIRSRPVNNRFRDNWERIWGNPNKQSQSQPQNKKATKDD